MLGDEARIQPREERFRSLDVARVPVHLERRPGVDRRLGDAGRLDVARRRRRTLRRLPERRAREVGLLPHRRVEHDVRHAAIRPLGAEERPQLLLGPGLVVPGAAEGHERRVPAPLVRVERPGRQRGRAEPVRVEHPPGRRPRAGRGSRRSSSWRSLAVGDRVPIERAAADEEVGHEARPAGLVRGADARPGVAVEVLVEQQEVAPLGVVAELRDSRRPGGGRRVRDPDGDETTRQVGPPPAVASGDRTGRVLDREDSCPGSSQRSSDSMNR